MHTKTLLPEDSRQKETHSPSVTATERGSRGSPRPAARTEAPICPGKVRNPGKGSAWWPGGAHSPFSRAPFSLLPHDQASPGSSTPSPPSFPLPPVTHKTRPPPPPPKSHQLSRSPLPTSQERTETAGQEAPQDGPHLPFSRSLLSPARGGQKRGRRGAGAAAAAAGLHAHASQLSRERRKKGARQGSARAVAAAALSTAPLCRGLARRQRLLPCRRLLPRRPASPAQLLIQPLPLTQRRRDTAGPPPPPPRVAAKVSLRAGEPLPRRRLPFSHERKWGAARAASAWRPREIRQTSGAELEAKGLPPAHSYGILSWAGRGGREATSNNIGPAWSGLLSAARPGRRLRRSLCGRCRPSQVEVRAPADGHLGRGCGRRRAAGGAAGRARGAARVVTRGRELNLRAWGRASAFFL